MRFLSPDECHRWAAARGLSFSPRPRYADLDDRSFTAYKFDIPSDAGRRVALTALLWDAIAHPSPETLLWVTEWGVWGSGEHMPLAATLRQAFGEARPLAEAPGHCFRMGEDADGISFLAVAMLFLWDAYLLSASGSVAAFISHDEYGVILARDEADLAPIKRRLEIFDGAAA